MKYVQCWNLKPLNIYEYLLNYYSAGGVAGNIKYNNIMSIIQYSIYYYRHHVKKKALGKSPGLLFF